MNSINNSVSIILLFASVLLLLGNPEPIEAGITSYLPSLQSFNPTYWLWSSSNRTDVSNNSTTGKLLSRSDNPNTTFHERAPMKNINPLISIRPRVGSTTPIPNLTSSPVAQSTIILTTTTTPSTLSAGSSTMSVVNLFTTQKPKIIINNKYNKTVKFQIKKNGRIYDAPVDANQANSPMKNNSAPEQIFDGK